MVFIGGATRLTGSGLSMTDWKPIHGIIPPIGVEEWQEEFNAYRASPEYQKINKGMSLDEFKKIFYWEYVHRIAGRTVGFVFLIPLIWFFTKKKLHSRKLYQLLGIFALGGLQGIIGWWMVKSGLIDEPKVSHFRLATHLSIAFLIFCLLFWQALCFYLTTDDNSKISKQEVSKIKSLTNISLLLLSIQIIYGAFVAGMDAGLVYNSWPLMDGDFIPVGFMNSGMLAIFNDITSVQFIHRWWAFIVLIAIILLIIRVRVNLKSSDKKSWSKTQIRLKKSSNMILAVTILQIIIGIKTIIMVVPISLALIHQFMALILLGNLVYILKTVKLARN
jgi:cytochrome c oxidase assembly protein subunit 15